MTKIKKRYDKNGGYLNHCVDRNITRRIKKEEVNNPEHYIRVDDTYFIQNEAIAMDMFKYTGLVAFGFCPFTSIY